MATVEVHSEQDQKRNGRDPYLESSVLMLVVGFLFVFYKGQPGNSVENALEAGR